MVSDLVFLSDLESSIVVHFTVRYMWLAGSVKGLRRKSLSHLLNEQTDKWLQPWEQWLVLQPVHLLSQTAIDLFQKSR